MPALVLLPSRRTVALAVVCVLAGMVAGAALLVTLDPQPVLYAGPGAKASARIGAERDAPYPKLDVFAKVLSYIRNNYVEDVDESQLVYGAVRGMVSTLDPHTVFMDPAEYRAMRDDTTGEFGGLGVEIGEKDGELVVMAPLEESPAARAGIRAGDVIRAIDGVSTRQLTVGEASTRLRGPAGTQVTLRLWRPEFRAPRDIVLVRDRIRVVSIESALLEGSVGYVKIKSFQDRTDQYLAKALGELRDRAGTRWEGLILDLRNNPGGLLEQGVRVADRFLESGLIVTTKGRGGRSPEQEKATARGTEPGYPIVLLVNAGTASASEILAGALQDHGRAVLMGVPTYGKGSVQTVIELDDGSGLKLTIARYYTPSGRSIQESGIVPDVTVHAGARDAELGREEMLPGHMRNESPGAPAITVDAARVVPVRTSGTASEDPQLEAALRALHGWKGFSRALAAARSPAR